MKKGVNFKRGKQNGPWKCVHNHRIAKMTHMFFNVREKAKEYNILI